MEKPGAASSPRQGQQQDGGAGSDRGSEQHRQYIRRLVHLRDTLITQEQTALARALDRLRLSSISNRDAARSVVLCWADWGNSWDFKVLSSRSLSVFDAMLTFQYGL